MSSGYLQGHWVVFCFGDFLLHQDLVVDAELLSSVEMAKGID
jgi:hypothetical protein